MEHTKHLRWAAVCLAVAVAGGAARAEQEAGAPAAPGQDGAQTQTQTQTGDQAESAPVPAREGDRAWREVVRITDNQTKRTETVPPHAMGITEQKGLVFYEGGEVGAVTLWFSWEGDSEESHYRGYGRYDFADGSSVFTSFEGAGALPGKQAGTLKFLGGTGRFEGIAGEGKFGAATMTPGSAGGDTFRDVQATYTLPARPATEEPSSKEEPPPPPPNE